MEKSANKVKIVIDLGFDKVMSEKELQKTFKQVKRCYSFNRRSKGKALATGKTFDEFGGRSLPKF